MLLDRQVMMEGYQVGVLIVTPITNFFPLISTSAMLGKFHEEKKKKICIELCFQILLEIGN